MTIWGSDLERIQRVCMHEAGHLIVARRLNFKTGGISVLFHPRSGHSGESIVEIHESIRNVIDLQVYLRKRIQVLYAGVFAEASWNGSYDATYAEQEWKQLGGMIDHAKIKELTHLLRCSLHPELVGEEEANAQLEQIGKELIKKCGDLVMDNLDLIKALSEKLALKVTEYSKYYDLTEIEIDNAFPQLRPPVGANDSIGRRQGLT